MNFKKDILLIDTEFSGFDLKKHELLQIAAVLLDKKTLKEKKSFCSYIKPTRWKHRDAQAMAVNQITWEMVKDAPSLRQVISAFDELFDHQEVLLASYVGFADKRYLLEVYSKLGLPFRFDYHYFDVWSACYAYFAAKGLLKSKKDFAGFGMDYGIKHFQIPSFGKQHDALNDCRIEAELLRRVMKEI